MKEQALKLKYNRGIIDTDIRFTRVNLLKLMLVSFFGGWVSGALGLGGGSIFTPLLLYMKVPASVAAATGMYMIMFSTIASCTLYVMYQILDY